MIFIVNPVFSKNIVVEVSEIHWFSLDKNYKNDNNDYKNDDSSNNDDSGNNYDNGLLTVVIMIK